jgi:hypothetical protein
MERQADLIELAGRGRPPASLFAVRPNDRWRWPSGGRQIPTTRAFFDGLDNAAKLVPLRTNIEIIRDPWPMFRPRGTAASGRAENPAEYQIATYGAVQKGGHA